MFEVSIATRGRCSAALAGLVGHAAGSPFPVRIVTPVPPSEPMLVETLVRLGCRVEVTYVDRPGLAHARAVQIEACREPVMVSIDDDAVMATRHGFWKLAALARGEAWAAPVVRFTQNFRNPPDGHTEVWEQVDPADPRLARAVARRGEGWKRTFDSGADVESSQLPGTCFAVETAVALPLAALLHQQRTGGPSDQWLGAVLGVGRILHDVHVYHWGEYSPAKWGLEAVAQALAENHPSEYQRIVSDPTFPHD